MARILVEGILFDEKKRTGTVWEESVNDFYKAYQLRDEYLSKTLKEENGDLRMEIYFHDDYEKIKQQAIDRVGRGIRSFKE